MASDAFEVLAVTFPCWMSAVELGEAFAARDLSPVEVIKSLLDRIEAIDGMINAFTCLDAGRALVAARIAEQEIAAGLRRSPLHGVPIGIKDIVDVAGLPTTCHSKILLGKVARTDASVIARLRAAGAIIIGKLSTHEFALGGPSFDLPFPPARNPWNRDHHSGGSSSGAGAGLAAGLFPLALGTDTAGSIRHPASACGIVGLKPTYGLVSRKGVFPLAFTLDHVGPMARRVADIALLLEEIVAEDLAGPGGSAALCRPFSQQLDGGVRGLRIGFVRQFHEIDEHADPEVGAALEEVAETLSREGASIRTVTLPRLQEFAGVNRVIMHSEAWSVHAGWLRSRPGDYGQRGRRSLMTGAFLSAGDYVKAQRRRSELISAVEDSLQDFDVLLTASSLDPACRIDDEAAYSRNTSRQARVPFNVTGHPALAMMSGLSKAGLPLSVQFACRYYGESKLLRVAAAYEHATQWYTRHPPAFSIQ